MFHINYNISNICIITYRTYVKTKEFILTQRFTENYFILFKGIYIYSKPK
jgi:hypothetical protein